MKREIIAERIFNWSNEHGQVRAAIYKPELDNETGDFKCHFELTNLPPGSSTLQHAWGADSLQALHEAIQGIRATIEPHKQLLRWGGDDWLGLPRPIPSGFGPEIDRRFENAITRESARLHKEFFGKTLGDTGRKRRTEEAAKLNSTSRARSNRKKKK